MSADVSGLLKFEGYEIDRALWQVRYGGEVLPLNRKTFDLLLYLLEHADRVVTKDELLRTLWPEQFIEESNLTQQIFLLRKALARHVSGAKIIATVPGRGYRFAVPVRYEPRPGPQAGAGHDSARGVEDSRTQASRDHEKVRVVEATTQPASPSHGTPRTVSTDQADFESKDPPGRSASLLRVPSFLLAMTTLAVILAAVFLLMRPKEATHVRVSAYTRITHDGHAKTIGGTDGSRVYFTRLEKSAIAQVSTSGKEEALMPIALKDPWSGAVSPDGSTLLIISQASGQGPASSLWTLRLMSGTLHRLGNAISSAWSPDGEAIVYASANGELFVTRYDGSETHRIAVVGGDIRSLAWSPDGHTIRFSRDGLLWQVSPSGSNLGQLLPGWGKTPTEWSGEWSSTGTYFFVADGQIWALENGKGLFRKTPDPAQLTYGPTVWDRPVLSRDGRQILASGRTRRGELVRFDPASVQPKTFLAGISAEFVTFSKSANAMAYVSYPDGILWRANVDGSSPTQLTESPVYPKSICWSPDGSQIAFVDRTADRASTIFVIASSGGGKPHRLIDTDNATESDPSWSPDGRRVVFSTAANVGASARSELRIFDLAAGKVNDVPGSNGLVVPRWSPDGRTIAAMTLDASSLKLLDVSSGRWSSLETGAVAFPEWSSDGRSIYYVRWTTNPAILRIRAADGKQEVLSDLTGARYTGVYTLWMGLDPSDRPMMLRDAGTDDIYALTLQ